MSSNGGPTKRTPREPRERYEAAAHAMQAGVAHEQAWGSKDGSPKHLRVGINARACDHTALVRLLIRKGLLDEDDYLEAIADQLEEEVRDYEARLSKAMGVEIHLL